MCLSSRCPTALLAAWVFFLAPSALPQQAVPSAPDIRIRVDRVNVGVVVTDSRGQFIGGLHRENFHLFDNGFEQPITDFLNVDEPAQVLLLIEAGPAVYLLEGGHLEAVHALLDGLSPSDRVAIARYNLAPEPLLDFTPDKSSAAAALDQLHFNLGFGQLNLASSLTTALDWLVQLPGKKSLVLLSTGIDTSPPAATQNLLARLESSDVRILAISLGGELRGAKPVERKHSKKDPPPPEKTQAAAEVNLGIERIFSYAAWADKFDGAVHNPPFRNVALAMNEPLGTVGIICPNQAPLLGFLSLVMPVLAAGNVAVVVPSETYPLITADLYQLFDTSDLPGGAVNIVTGYTSQLLKTLAEHDDVDAVWCFADEASAVAAKTYSIGNLKQVFTNEGRSIDWFDVEQGEGRWFLQHATQVKNIWVPYGE